MANFLHTPKVADKMSRGHILPISPALAQRPLIALNDEFLRANPRRCKVSACRVTRSIVLIDAEVVHSCVDMS